MKYLYVKKTLLALAHIMVGVVSITITMVWDNVLTMEHKQRIRLLKHLVCFTGQEKTSPSLILRSSLILSVYIHYVTVKAKLMLVETF